MKEHARIVPSQVWEHLDENSLNYMLPKSKKHIQNAIHSVSNQPVSLKLGRIAIFEVLYQITNLILITGHD